MAKAILSLDRSPCTLLENAYVESIPLRGSESTLEILVGSCQRVLAIYQG